MTQQDGFHKALLCVCGILLAINGWLVRDMLAGIEENSASNREQAAAVSELSREVGELSAVIDGVLGLIDENRERIRALEGRWLLDAEKNGR